jgi:hypothetical protein
MKYNHIIEILKKLPTWNGRIHGNKHWYRVMSNGIRIANNTPGVDREVVELFALLHDSMRENDGEDPYHGYRAANLAEKLREYIDLNDTQFEKLTYALSHHTDETHHLDETIGACWDSDRLDLGRVGVIPNKYYLNTDYAKEIVDSGNLYGIDPDDYDEYAELDRMDDAVRACKSAIEEGISTGGGVTLLRCIESLDSVECSNEDEKAGVNIVKKAMEVPLRQMLKNAGLDESYIVSKVKEGKGGYGFNIKTMEYCDLSETGVVDPTKVIRVALQNAASVAGQMITSNSLIVNMKEK